MDLSIVIPAYREQVRLPRTLLAAFEYFDRRRLIDACEVVVADDGSDDDTAAVVSELGRQREWGEHLRVLRRPHRGKGAATAAGMLAARGALRFLCDADHAMPFSELDRFLARARAGVDVVIGSRQIAGAGRENEPFRRHLLGRGFNALVRMLVVPGIQDTQCGYKLFRAEAAEWVFRRLTVDGFAFDVEALHLARRGGFSIEEMPIHWIHDPDSRVAPHRHGFEMFRDVLAIRWREWRGGSPAPGGRGHDEAPS